MSPAKVLKVELLPGEPRSCRVTVPDQQLSLAIGNKGREVEILSLVPDGVRQVVNLAVGGFQPVIQLPQLRVQRCV